MALIPASSAFSFTNIGTAYSPVSLNTVPQIESETYPSVIYCTAQGHCELKGRLQKSDDSNKLKLGLLIISITTIGVFVFTLCQLNVAIVHH